MGKTDKLLEKILGGKSDNNIRFIELCNFLSKFGFTERIKGSHHIFYKVNIDEIINVQEKDGYSKSYQVKQVREMILKYRLEIKEDET